MSGPSEFAKALDAWRSITARSDAAHAELAAIANRLRASGADRPALFARATALEALNEPLVRERLLRLEQLYETEPTTPEELAELVEVFLTEDLDDVVQVGAGGVAVTTICNGVLRLLQTKGRGVQASPREPSSPSLLAAQTQNQPHGAIRGVRGDATSPNARPLSVP